MILPASPMEQIYLQDWDLQLPLVGQCCNDPYCAVLWPLLFFETADRIKNINHNLKEERSDYWIYTWINIRSITCSIPRSKHIKSQFSQSLCTNLVYSRRLSNTHSSHNLAIGSQNKYFISQISFKWTRYPRTLKASLWIY